MPARAVLLVLGAVASVQFGAALAVTLFDDVGPLGTVFLRLALGAVVLVAVLRPRLRDLARRDVLLFGLALAGMNGFYYLALDHIDQGVAVTFEMAGPLGVAVAGSRRAVDLAWVALAGAGVVLLTGGLGSDLDWAGVLMSLEPASAALAGFVVLGQDLGTPEIAAIALVVTASAGAARSARDDAPPLVVD